ncbi:MAG: 2-amino-4-hydroxy-6-hydroxymethyldihydropteridine diphosphokinase [Opitutae bacterium]|nr:2-amino-4-hydroxy-6-hydroxymethyldihydropteridine diphosphokinase [Opitutae bacterium]MCD8299436.1 2-amino-4-hydroxy-6-hydroxymethyldihydropteridine diphosphokinase [Opitutae bacterium]
MDEKIAIIALGANLGEREKTLTAALARLSERGIVVRAVSPFYETVPVGFVAQPDFINAVAAVAVPAEMTPENLLEVLMATEREFGRERKFLNAPRTCDLDLIFFENETRNSPELTLPHPRWRERAFVLVPLADLFSRHHNANDGGHHKGGNGGGNSACNGGGNGGHHKGENFSWQQREIWSARAAEVCNLLRQTDVSGVKTLSGAKQKSM